MPSAHVPVLLDPVVALLAPRRPGLLVDATLGLAGHASALLATYPELELLGVDRDPAALARAEQHLARALEEARHFGDRLTTAELLIERARARASRGRLAEARRCCEEALRLAAGIQWAVGVEHAERAIAMLDRKSPPTRSAGPAERSGSYPRPS